MRKFALIFGKEAAPKVRSGSYADGAAGQGVRLPLAVVGPHINLPSSDHSEVASDANRFASCFLALCAKTLIKTYYDFGNTYSHNRKLLVVLESLERLVKSTSSALLPKKRASATRQMLPHVSLEEQTLKVLVFPLAKVRHISESTKYSESALSQKMEHLPLFWQTLRYFSLGERPKLYENNNPSQRYLYLPDLQALAVPYGKRLFPVRNLSARPFGSANSLFPYEILMRRHLVRQTAFSRTESTPFSVQEVLSTACGTEIGPLLYGVGLGARRWSMAGRERGVWIMAVPVGRCCGWQAADVNIR